MSTLAVVERVLRETRVPMSVREIVEHAGDSLPTRSKTPDTVVARDLSMDIKRKGEESDFVRTAPGRYTMRALVAAVAVSSAAATSVATAPSEATATSVAAEPVTAESVTAEATGVLSKALRHERQATMAAKRLTRAETVGGQSQPS